VVVAAVLTPLVVVVAVRYAPRCRGLVYLLQPMLLAIYMGGSRALYRTWKEFRLYGGLRAQGQPVLVLGAARRRSIWCATCPAQPSGGWSGCSTIRRGTGARDPWVRGAGRHRRARRLAEEMKVGHAIIAMPSEGHERRVAASACVRAGVKALILPGIEDVMTGRVNLSQVRQVDVEDLLGRDPVRIHTAEVREYLRGKAVMVTGRGSIGSELCRQIARFEPSVLVCFELNEFALYRLTEEFAVHFPPFRWWRSPAT
jgi:FlaA1/EpsC-like NDP-sugar epimerase